MPWISVCWECRSGCPSSVNAKGSTICHFKNNDNRQSSSKGWNCDDQGHMSTKNMNGRAQNGVQKVWLHSVRGQKLSNFRSKHCNLEFATIIYYRLDYDLNIFIKLSMGITTTATREQSMKCNLDLAMETQRPSPTPTQQREQHLSGCILKRTWFNIRFNDKSWWSPFKGAALIHLHYLLVCLAKKPWGPVDSASSSGCCPKTKMGHFSCFSPSPDTFINPSLPWLIIRTNLSRTMSK